MKQGKILIVDDNVHVLTALSQLLESEFGKVISVDDPKQIPGILQIENIDVILLDMNFKQGDSSGREGLLWLKTILQKDPDMVVILITAYGDINLAIKGIKDGALDFVLKPWDNDKLITTINSGLKLRRSRNLVESLKSKQRHLNEIILDKNSQFIGSSGSVILIKKLISKIAPSNCNVLVLGESGTGKELIAKEIHNLSDREGEVFVHVDMGAISDTLFESELFGHVRGAFTDASKDRAGRFEIASGGTLFLDEIGNLTPGLQSKLLNVIQNREVTRLGSNKPVSVDVRIICATNMDINKMIEENMFREDLYYRINTIEIIIPPLRERKEDIIQLSEYFLEEFRKNFSKGDVYFSRSFKKYLLDQDWPGNVRQLRSCIEKAVLLAESNVINPEGGILKGSHSPIEKDTAWSLQEIEKEILLDVLSKNNGNIKKTAEELGIARSTVYNKLKKNE